MKWPITEKSKNPMFSDLIYPDRDDAALSNDSTVRYYFLPPRIILSKNISGEGPSPFSIHLNTLNKGTKNVSSQALLSIHVCHTR